jgi:hypothetical protein
MDVIAHRRKADANTKFSTGQEHMIDRAHHYF